MAERVKITIPGNPEYLTMVRLAIGSIAAIEGFDMEAIEDIKTAVTEACMVSYCHKLDGYAREYTVCCDIDEDKLSFTIEASLKDKIPKFTKRCLDCPDEGEIGLNLIDTLMDEFKTDWDDDKRMMKLVKLKK